MLQDLCDEFAYAIYLNLKIGYYTIMLDPDAQKWCTSDTNFGKYQ
jgi:hypothetical protein